MYKIFNFSIESNLHLPELPEIETGNASISFELLSTPPEKKQLDWFHHWRLPDGQITISCAKLGEDYYLRFPYLADFHIFDDCSGIRCYPCPGVTDEMVRHLLLDQVIPRVVGYRGHIVLHASAVRIDGVAIAFLGETGWGKSTLATSFHMNGYPLLTDDSLLIDQQGKDIIGLPGYVGARLWQDSFEAFADELQPLHELAQYSSKKRLNLHENSKADNYKLPIKAIFILGMPNQLSNEGKIRITEIIGARKIIELVKHTFTLDVTDKDRTTDIFRKIGVLATSEVPKFNLHYPHDHKLLARIRDMVIKTVVAGSCTEDYST